MLHEGPRASTVMPDVRYDTLSGEVIIDIELPPEVMHYLRNQVGSTAIRLRMVSQHVITFIGDLSYAVSNCE